MKIEERNGSYRVRKTINGKTYSKTFDHKPLKREVEEAFKDVTDQVNGNLTFEKAALAYIDARRDVLSPSTIKEYSGTLKRLSRAFTGKFIDVITQNDVQREINLLSKERAAKTVRNYHGFISSVLAEFRPSLVLHTTLPKKESKDVYIPTSDDIKAILKVAEGTPMELPILLGCASFRRGEICALTMDDIDFENNIISITKDVVYSEDNEWVVKPPKTPESVRDVIVPQRIIDVIKERGLYEGHPNNITDWMTRTEDSLGLPRFSIHKCRHFFASEAHAKGIPDADIMKAGGWKTDHVMKTVYRHSLGNNSDRVSSAVLSDII